MRDGSYKEMLITRARKVRESAPPDVQDKPLDYLELANRRSMTAWRKKFETEKGND